MATSQATALHFFGLHQRTKPFGPFGLLNFLDHSANQDRPNHFISSLTSSCITSFFLFPSSHPTELLHRFCNLVPLAYTAHFPLFATHTQQPCLAAAPHSTLPASATAPALAISPTSSNGMSTTPTLFAFVAALRTSPLRPPSRPVSPAIDGSIRHPVLLPRLGVALDQTPRRLVVPSPSSPPARPKLSLPILPPPSLPRRLSVCQMPARLGVALLVPVDS